MDPLNNSFIRPSNDNGTLHPFAFHAENTQGNLLILPKAYIKIFSNYFKNIPSTDLEFIQELKNLEISQFETVLEEILHLYSDDLSNCHAEIAHINKELFFYGMSIIQNDSDAQRLKNIHKFKSHLKEIAPVAYMGRDNNIVYFDYYDLITKRSNAFLPQDPKTRVEKMLDELEEFRKFPEILGEIKNFYKERYGPYLINSRLFWQNTVEAIRLLDILLSHGNYEIVFELSNPVGFDNNKKVLIEIFKKFEKYSADPFFIECLEDFSFIEYSIKQCFKEIKAVDFENKTLTCLKPEVLLPELCKVLSIETVIFKESDFGLFQQKIIETTSEVNFQENRLENSQADLENTQTDLKINIKKRPRDEYQTPLNPETEIDSKTDLKVAKQQKQADPNPFETTTNVNYLFEEWIDFFENVKNANITIDLSLLNNFHLEHLRHLSSKPIHIHLNSYLLKNKSESLFSFDHPFLKITWHMECPIDAYQLQQIQKSHVVELKINTSQYNAYEIQEMLTKINPETLTLSATNHQPSNISIHVIQNCSRLKKVHWDMSLDSIPLRAIFCNLIERGIQIYYHSRINFNPRKGSTDENDEIKSDVINCLRIVEYLMRNEEYSKGMVIKRLVLTDSDIPLLQEYPLAGFQSLLSSTYDLTITDSIPLLKSFEAQFVQLRHNEGNLPLNCSAQRFTQIFTKESVIECPRLACAYWLLAAKDTQMSHVSVLLDIFDIISPYLDEETLDIVKYYEAYLSLIHKIQDYNFDINLAFRLDFLYKTTKQKQELKNSKTFLNNLLQLPPLENSENYFELLIGGLRNRLLEDKFNISHLDIDKLKKLLRLFESINPPYDELTANLLHLIPIEVLNGPELKCWIKLAEGLNYSLIEEKIKNHFDKCHRFLSLETKKSYASIIVNNNCSFENFEPALRILINYSSKFPLDFIEFHIEHLLNFLSKHRADSTIIIKFDNLLDIPEGKGFLIDAILQTCFKTDLAIDQEDTFLQVFENYIALPKRKIKLPEIKSENLIKKICEISKKHSYFHPVILSKLIDMALKSENPITECIYYIETIPRKLNEDLWAKIFSNSHSRSAIMNGFLGGSIVNRMICPENLIQGLAKNISEHNPDEITKFIHLTDRLMTCRKLVPPSVIELPRSFIAPLLTIIEKESLILKYSLGVCHLLGNCLEEVVIRPNDISVIFFNILKQLTKAKKNCIDKVKKGEYKRHRAFVYNFFAAELTHLYHLPENIFDFCLKFIENFQDHLLVGDFENLKEIILSGLIRQINNGFSLPQTLLEDISNLVLSWSNASIQWNIQDANLASILLKKFLSKWNEDMDHQLMNPFNFSILINCLTFPREEHEQRALSEILSKGEMINFDFLNALNEADFSKNPLFCSLLLDSWVQRSPSAHTKQYVYSFILYILRSGLFKANKENILHLINSNAHSNTDRDFYLLFQNELSEDDLSYISSNLVNNMNGVSQGSNLSKIALEQKFFFHLSRYAIDLETIKQKALEIAQVEIIVPPGGEALNLEKYLEYFQKIDNEVVQTYASFELIAAANKQKITCHALFLKNLKNLIDVLTKNESVEFSPDDIEERRNFYSVIIHDLKATLFHIHSHIGTLNEHEAIHFLNQNAQIFITLAEAGAKGVCIFPYQTAAQSIYRMIVPSSNTDKIDMSTIEGKITKNVLNFLWVCINKVITSDPRSLNTHTRNAYIKFFEKIFGPEIGSTKVIKEDRALFAELNMLEEVKGDIFDKLKFFFNLVSCFNFICENWGHTSTNPKESYNIEDLNAWIEQYSKKNNIENIPYQAAWNEDNSFPWPGLVEILNTIGIFKKRFTNESSLFDLLYRSNTMNE